MKFWIMIISVALLFGCAVHQPTTIAKNETTMLEPVVEQKIYGDASIITNQALKSYKEDYLKASTHKAFAQSDSGAWAWKSNRTSAGHAVKSALIGCRANNKKHEESFPCMIINIDEEWVEER